MGLASAQLGAELNEQFFFFCNPSKHPPLLTSLADSWLGNHSRNKWCKQKCMRRQQVASCCRPAHLHSSAGWPPAITTKSKQEIDFPIGLPEKVHMPWIPHIVWSKKRTIKMSGRGRLWCLYLYLAYNNYKFQIFEKQYKIFDIDEIFIRI